MAQTRKKKKTGINRGTDVMTPEQRSRCMSKIRGKNTKPELALRQLLWSKGLRYRIHYKMRGHPDIMFPGAKVAVFVDGCFWHGCKEHGVSPKSNADFWKSKLSQNVIRDSEVNRDLSSEGWTVLRFWEHEVEDSVESVVDRVAEIVRDSEK